MNKNFMNTTAYAFCGSIYLVKTYTRVRLEAVPPTFMSDRKHNLRPVTVCMPAVLHVITI